VRWHLTHIDDSLRESIALFGVPIASVLAIPDEFQFLAEGSYIEQSGSGFELPGIYYVGDLAYVVGDNGDTLFQFILTKKG
jgi:hypothetical protein